jgi:hypothetical protein
MAELFFVVPTLNSELRFEPRQGMCLNRVHAEEAALAYLQE